jgi:hypothetical protein
MQNSFTEADLGPQAHHAGRCDDGMALFSGSGDVAG